jgi:hypothetical protein
LFSIPSTNRASAEIGMDLALRPYPASRRDQRRIVIGPGTGGPIEKAPALAEARLGVRVRVEKNVLVVEGPDELDVPREQHPVAEHVAAHIADPDDREGLLLRYPRRGPRSGVSLPRRRRGR